MIRAYTQGVDTKDRHSLQCFEYGYDMAPPSLRRILEELMETKAWPVHSPFAKHHFSRGEEKGRAEGEARGEAKGEAKSLLLFLAARGIDVSDDIRERIIGCTDTDRLERWVRRAATVDTAEELFT